MLSSLVEDNTLEAVGQVVVVVVVVVVVRDHKQTAGQAVQGCKGIAVQEQD